MIRISFGREKTIVITNNAAGGPPVVDHTIKVAIITEAANALERSQERDGLNRTDIINRALIMYNDIGDELQEHGRVEVQSPDWPNP